MKLKAYFKENETARDILILSLVYILAHGFILFLTGTFWDDWTAYFHDVVAKDLEGWESGRPYYSFLIKLGWFGNSFGYRKLIFFIYYFYYLLAYLILRSIPLFKGKSPLYITALTICVPINDARVILANFPYAIGLLLFAAGFYVFIKRVNGKKNCIQFRLLSWLLFFASFILNSNLVMFGAVILYILITNRNLRKILGYTDFIISPIIFFTLNKILFPTYGHYANYNKVTLYGLVKSVLNIPLAILKQTGKIAYRFANSSYIILGIMAFIWLVFLLIDLKINKIDELAKNKIAIFVLGTVLLILGMYPYMVVRGSAGFSIAWIDGRDSMQLGIGCAMMIYAIFPRSKEVFFTMTLALLGIFQFNTAYLQYQREWYRELSFKNELISLDDARKIGGAIT